VNQLPVLVAPGQRRVVGGQERRVGRHRAQPLGGNLLQHPHRVVRGPAPERVVEPAEDVARAPVPTPPEIDGQLVQAMDATGSGAAAAKRSSDMGLDIRNGGR
jgi:hypothetical protein